MIDNPTDEFYHSKWKSIVNVMKSSNLKISKIAQHGSRARKLHRPDSDMDVIFSVSGNPIRENFYPELIRILHSNFPNEKVYAGREYHVVHLDFRNGGKFDLILLSENDFDKEYTSILEYKRRNL